MPETQRAMKPLKPDDIPYLTALTERITYHQQQCERLRQDALQHDKTLYILQMVQQRANGKDACKGMLAARISDELDEEVAHYVKLAKRHNAILTLLEDELATFIITNYKVSAKNQYWNLDLAKKALYRMPPKTDLNGNDVQRGGKEDKKHDAPAK